MENPVSLERDSRVTRLDSSTYAATLTKTFCVGSVSMGGYLAAIFIRVASEHLGPRGQPDSIAAHWQFFGASLPGRSVFVVEEAKLGRGTSVLHITLYQDGLLLEQSPWITSESKKRSVAYVTNSRHDSEHGLTLPTTFAWRDPPPPVNLEKLAAGHDPNWKRFSMRFMKKAAVLAAIEIYVPKNGPMRLGTQDFWVRLADGDGFNNASLGFLADLPGPFVVETFRPSDPKAPVPRGGFAFDSLFWFPTLAMSIDIKKALPAGGAKWLRLRGETKVLQRGRLDCEVTIFDSDGDVVALCTQAALVVDAQAVLSKERKKEEAKL